MKLQFTIIGVLFLFNTLVAQENTTLSGKITKPTTRLIQLDLTDANQKKISIEDSLNANDEFTLKFALESPATGKFSDGNEITSIYFEPGDNVNLTLNTEQFDETVNYTGKGAANNNYLARYYLLFTDPDNTKSKKADDVIYTLRPEDYLKFIDSVNNAKNKFLELFSKENQLYEDATLKLQYAVYNQSFKDTIQEYQTNYLSFVKQIPTQNQNPLTETAYQTYLQQYIPYEFRNRYNVAELTEKEINAKLCFFLKEVLKPDLAYAYIANILMNHLQSGADPDELKEAFDDFYANCKNEEYVAQLKKMQSDTKKLAVGQPAPDFELKDVEGKTVKLSDFKGKTVYIDFWASWCGPCIQEIPAAKELKDKYKKKKNLVFLYISVDQEKDDWLAALKKHKLKGNHLINNEESNPAQAYGVRFIPFFVIIDKNGNFAKYPAKRPSDEGITDEIDEVLNKK